MPEPLQLNEPPPPPKRKRSRSSDGTLSAFTAGTDFMRLARERFTESASADAQNRLDRVDDRLFARGGRHQWKVGGQDIQAQRWKKNQPALTVNRIPGFVKQVTNSIREARPGIEYVPVDDSSDPETAEVLQGLARHVEQNSFADQAYETAASHAVIAGLGWFYATIDYAHDVTTDLEVFIKRVRNPETIYRDPAAQECDWSDASFLLHVEDMRHALYQVKYGADAPIASLEEFRSIGDSSSFWMPGRDRIRVANYFYIQHIPKRLVPVLPIVNGLPDISVPPKLLFLEDLKPEQVPGVLLDQSGGPMILRTVKVPTVMYAKINGLGVIDGNADKTGGRPFPGRYIPYCPVIGDEDDVDGDLDIRGMVRDLKDPQAMVNFWNSAITERIALAGKAPYIVAEGQIHDGNKGVWETANLENYAYLPYRPVVIGGVLAPAPHLESVEPAVQAMVMANQMMEQNLRAIAGFYDVESRDTKEVTGRAILARQQQGERGNSHFHGNLARSIRHMGRILLPIFTHVYSTARVKRILGDDETERAVQIYAGEANKPTAPQQTPDGKVIKAFDLSVGRYDVRSTVGPSYATKRKEALAALLELVTVVPSIAQVGADIIVQMMDAPFMRELAKRLKKLVVPPEALEDEQDPDAKIMRLQGQMQQMGKMYDLLVGELNTKSAMLETEAAKSAAQERIKVIEIESKERLAMIQQQIELLKIQASQQSQQLSVQADQQAQAMDAESKRQQTVLQAEIQRVNSMVTTAMSQTHDERMADKAAATQKEQMALQAAMTPPESPEGAPAP